MELILITYHTQPNTSKPSSRQRATPHGGAACVPRLGHQCRSQPTPLRPAPCRTLDARVADTPPWTRRAQNSFAPRPPCPRTAPRLGDGPAAQAVQHRARDGARGQARAPLAARVLRDCHATTAKTTTARSPVRDKDPPRPRVLTPSASLQEARGSSWWLRDSGSDGAARPQSCCAVSGQPERQPLSLRGQKAHAAPSRRPAPASHSRGLWLLDSEQRQAPRTGSTPSFPGPPGEHTTHSRWRGWAHAARRDSWLLPREHSGRLAQPGEIRPVSAARGRAGGCRARGTELAGASVGQRGSNTHPGPHSPNTGAPPAC